MRQPAAKYVGNPVTDQHRKKKFQTKFTLHVGYLIIITLGAAIVNGCTYNLNRATLSLTLPQHRIMYILYALGSNH